jgi:hypothetical protein
VSLRRLRAGEWLAAVGAVALLALLAATWFAADEVPRGAEVSTSGLGSLGWLMVAWLVSTALGGLWLALATAADAPVSRLMATAVILVVVAGLALVATALRVLVLRPGLGAGLPNEDVTVAAGGWLGLAATAAVLAGAWWAMADERTTAPESAYTPPPARPAPTEEP